MKGSVIALFCAVALVRAEINENRVPGSAGTLFSLQPDNGGVNGDPSLAPEICSAEGSDGVLVAHENCNKFYECDNAVPVAHKCASTLQFNPSIGKCDWPENVNCGDRNPDGDNGGNGGSGEGGNGDSGSGGGSEESGNGGNSNPGEAPEICAAEGSDGVLVAHENCNQFYKCSEGVPVALKCWGNLLFNPANNQCDWPENVKCGDRNPDGGNGDGDNGDGGNGDVGNGDNSNGGNGNPNEAPTICAAEGSEGVLVAHENCRKFYKCSRGIPVAMSCWGNLLFNPANDQCDWPENVDCGERNVGGNHGRDDGNQENGGNGESGPVGNNKPGEAKEVCAAEGSDGVLVAHEKCNQFYKCDRGVPVAMRCGGILLYNAATEQCDWPENVKCAEKIPDGGNGEDSDSDKVGGGNSDPSKAPEICAVEDSEGVLVAHENCNQFYICNGGKPVAMNCWGDLLFNPATGECDWADNVNCGSRNAFTSLNKHLLIARRV